MARKFFATFVTFAFIYIWHGYYLVILVWSSLNLLGILLEDMLKAIQESKLYHKHITGRFSPNNVLRIEAVAGTHLLILAVISNFFFLANYEVGVMFVTRIYGHGLGNYLLLSTSLVFIYFTSEYCKRRIKKDQANDGKLSNNLIE